MPKRMIAAAWLIALAAGYAPPQAVRPAQPLQHEVSVVLKLIQVFVTDKDGRPVPDLNKSDFVVRQDGREVALTAFERHSIAIPNPPPAPAAKPAEAAPAPPTPAGADKPAPALSRKYFLFFDFAFNNPAGVRKAQKMALHFLDTKLGPDDEVGLITYSLTRGLNVPDLPTRDHARVRKMVETLDMKSIAGRVEDTEAMFWTRIGEEMTAADAAEIRDKRNEQKQAAQKLLLTLTDLAKGLRYIAGLKHILLFSTGVPMSMIYGNATEGYFEKTYFDTGDHVLRTQNEAMLKEFSSANCAIYTFDTRAAAKVASLFDYDEATFGRRVSRGMFTESGVTQNKSLILKNDNVTGMYPLERLAKQTGGRYFSNADEYERNMDTLGALTGTYYVLGYSVDQLTDGAYHTVKVSVRRKGCEVRAQTGYFNPRPFREFTDLEKRLHLLDLALSPSPQVQAALSGLMTALAFPGAEKNGVYLLTRLETDLTSEARGRIELSTFILDEKGEAVDVKKAEETPASFGSRALFYLSRAVLAPGSYTGRLVARDIETGEAVVASTRFYVPAPAAGLRFLTPLFLAPATGALILEGRVKEAEPAAAPSSWAAFYPIDASRFTPLLGPVPKGAAKISVLLPCLVADIGASRLAIKATLQNAASGAAAPVALVSGGLSVRGNAFIQIFEVPLEGLGAGSYLLHFYGEDAASKALAHTTAALTIR